MKYTNKHNLPESIFNALTYDDYDLTNAPDNIISVTSLIDSPKAKILYKRHLKELEIDAIDRLWCMDGSADHYILDMANKKNKNALSEERWYYNVEKDSIYTLAKDEKVMLQSWYSSEEWYVSGKFDNYFNNILEDYKRTSVWNYVYNPDGKPEYHKQLNIHGFILNKMGFKIEKLRIVMILKDWQKSKKFDVNYPKIPIQEINIPIWEDVKVYEYLLARLNTFKEMFNCEDDVIPHCTKEERWYKEGKLAVMKEGRKSALKLFSEDKPEDAERYKAEQGSGKYYIETRPGKNNRCEDYCDCNKFCNFFKGLKNGSK